MIVFGNRASALLFNFLKGLKNKGPFLLPVNICPIVTSTFLKANRKFEFVDISLETFCMDEQLLLEKLQRGEYAGVLFVRTYGTCRTFVNLFDKIKKINKDIVIIDDNCLGVPSFTKSDEQVDMVLYSTGYSKIVNLGAGGHAIIKEKYYYKEYKDNPYTQELNRIDNKFQTIDEYKNAVCNEVSRIKEHKKKLNHIYSTHLPKEIQLLADFQQWRFNILVFQKDKLLEEIFAQGLFASSHYAPNPERPGNETFPNAQYLHSRVVNLFNDRYFDEGSALRTCQIITRHVTRYPS